MNLLNDHTLHTGERSITTVLSKALNVSLEPCFGYKVHNHDSGSVKMFLVTAMLNATYSVLTR